MPSTVADNPLAVQLREAEIVGTEAAVLETTFAPFFQAAQEWRKKAEAIQVTSGDDKPQIKAAREARLALKEIRVTVDKRRKELKEESLRKGKAIDGMANVIKFLIAPIEEHLEKQEKFVQLQEEQRLQKLKESRAAELSQFGVDVSFYDLAAMPEENYAKLLDGSRKTFEEARAASEKLEQERREKEIADAEERERLRVENERLKKQAEADRLAREKIEADARAKAAAEEQARQEEKRKRHQELVAPDREKLDALAGRIAAVQLPEVTSDEAQAVIKQVAKLLSAASQFVKQKSISL